MFTLLGLLLTACAPAVGPTPEAAKAAITEAAAEVPSKAPDSVPVTLKIAVLPIIDTLPMYVARQEDLFIKHGINVEFIPVASAPERDQILAAGQADGTINETLAVMMFNKDTVQMQVVRYALVPSEGHGHFFILAADFTLTMMRVGNQRYGPLPWCAADALALPFASQSFDAVVSGFLMRNVIDMQQALREQYRILKPGGKIVILDTTRPQKNLFSPLIWLHMHLVIPTLGRLLSGEKDAYHYLPDSTEGFVSAEQLTDRLVSAGFVEVGYRRRMFGTIAIHWGQKAGDSSRQLSDESV